MRGPTMETTITDVNTIITTQGRTTDSRCAKTHCNSYWIVSLFFRRTTGLKRLVLPTNTLANGCLRRQSMPDGATGISARSTIEPCG